MSESSPTLVQTTEDAATTLSPSEQTFLQAFAQEVMQYDFVEAVLYKKQYWQLYVRTVIRSRELDDHRAVVRAWGATVRNHDMSRMPFPDHLTVRPPSTTQDMVAAGFRIFATKQEGVMLNG